MGFSLSEAALTRAIGHLSRFGDTDVFPHLPEIAFAKDDPAGLVTELASLDLDSFTPAGAIEALAPKSRFGFRIVHQLPLLENILFLASVLEIGPEIETHRPSVTSLAAFSYRFDASGTDDIFKPGRTYRHWISAQDNYLKTNLKIKKVVSTDISDYYARINFHRLENLLDEAAPSSGAARFIKKQIRIIRAKQSFGLPVGGSAARLLAELSMSDLDRALIDHGIRATRFVDDFRIFLEADENPYDVLGYLAEQLGINEGLSLNVAKTHVTPRSLYVARLKMMATDIADEAEGVALDALTSSLYFDEEPDQGDLEKLKGLNLIGFLNDELSKDNYDVGHVKVIFRALKLALPHDAVEFVRTNFSELVVFAKETALLMEALDDEFPGAFHDMADDLIAAITEPPASSIQTIRAWLLELFVRGVVMVEAKHIKQLATLPSSIDKRQLMLIRGRRADKAYFRSNKTAFGQYTPFEQVCLVWGASCLPKDEFENWVTFVKPSYKSPIGQRFLTWASKNQSHLVAKLSSGVEDQSE